MSGEHLDLIFYSILEVGFMEKFDNESNVYLFQYVNWDENKITIMIK